MNILKNRKLFSKFLYTTTKIYSKTNFIYYREKRTKEQKHRDYKRKRLEEGQYQSYDGFQKPRAMFSYSPDASHSISSEKNSSQLPELFPIPTGYNASSTGTQFGEAGVCYPKPVSGTFPIKNDIHNATLHSANIQSGLPLKNFSVVSSPNQNVCPSYIQRSKLSTFCKKID